MLRIKTVLCLIVILGLGCVHGAEPAKDQAAQEAAALTKQADQYRYAPDDQKDLQQAARLYAKAAELGDAYAQCSLGFLHLNGEGVEESKAKAKAYFELAAKQGELDARLQLGRLKLADGNKREAIRHYDALVEESISLGDISTLAAVRRIIAAHLTSHNALDETADYLDPLAAMQAGLPDANRMQIADLFYFVGDSFSRRSIDKRRHPEIRYDLEVAQKYLGIALRLYRDIHGGDKNVQVAKTLDAMGSANLKRSGVSTIHLPTYREYKRGGTRQLEEAHRIYCEVLGSDHETSKELREFIDGIPNPIMSDGRP